MSNDETLSETIAKRIGVALGRMLRKYRQTRGTARNNRTRIVLWSPDCENAEALRVDILVSIGRRSAIIDTGVTGLKCIPVSTICSVR